MRWKNEWMVWGITDRDRKLKYNVGSCYFYFIFLKLFLKKFIKFSVAQTVCRKDGIRTAKNFSFSATKNEIKRLKKFIFHFKQKPLQKIFVAFNLKNVQKIYRKLSLEWVFVAFLLLLFIKIKHRK